MSLSPELVAQRIRAIQQTIPDNVTLIAVTKQVPVELMAIAYDMGIRNFGESKVQEAAEKQAQLDRPGITWHLIGHLQRNKAAKALQQFQWIHSLDSIKLAKRLDQLAEAAGDEPRVCLQVKLRHDPSKYGWSPEELLPALPQLNQCKNLRIEGLMAIPPYGLSEEETRAIFEETRSLADKISQLPLDRLKITQLSIGMLNDYLLAIASGATMVRLGRVIFGERQY